jgi:mycothiol system anti-sigma-R factor
MTDCRPRAFHCSETVALLYPYLDRELTPEEQAIVQGHLDACGPCARHFRFEAAVLSLVGLRLGRVTAPPALRARIASLTDG